MAGTMHSKEMGRMAPVSGLWVSPLPSHASSMGQALLLPTAAQTLPRPLSHSHPSHWEMLVQWILASPPERVPPAHPAPGRLITPLRQHRGMAGGSWSPGQEQDLPQNKVHIHAWGARPVGKGQARQTQPRCLPAAGHQEQCWLPAREARG